MQNVSKHAGQMLHMLRKQRQWSLDKAGQQTGVSKAMLGQIERGESSPTIATLWKIASGFNVSFSSFLPRMEQSEQGLVAQPSHIDSFPASDNQIRVTPLFPFDPELNCEIFLNELQPNAEHLSPPHQAGVIEHVIVINGSMQLLLDGQWQTLLCGTGLRFHADIAHGYRNPTANPASFHNIIHYCAQL